MSTSLAPLGHPVCNSIYFLKYVLDDGFSHKLLEFLDIVDKLINMPWIVNVPFGWISDNFTVSFNLNELVTGLDRFLESPS